MKLEFNYHNSVIVLPGAVLSKIETASENDLRALIYLAANEGLRADFSPEKLAAAIGISENDASLSLAFWRGAGLIKVLKSGEKKAVPGDENTPATEEEGKEAQKPIAATHYTVDSLPDYSGKQLEELIKEREEVAVILKETQKVLGKVFNVSESNKIIALYDYLHLPEEYILLLSAHCKYNDKGSVAYVAATAKELFNADITTVGALENYIADKERARDFENYMRKLLGIGGRKLTAKEKRFFEAWQQSELPKEVIAKAYETSVDAIGEFSAPHMNKIIESYKKTGVTTAEEAEKQNEEHRREFQKQYVKKSSTKAKEDKSDFKTFEVDEFFDLAKKKSREKMSANN